FMSKSELGEFTEGCDDLSSTFQTLRTVFGMVASGARSGESSYLGSVARPVRGGFLVAPGYPAGRLPPAARLDPGRRQAGAPVGRAGNEPQPRSGPGPPDAGGDAIGGAAVGCAGAGHAAPGGGNTAPAHRVAGATRRALGGAEAAPGRDRRRPGRDGRTGP